MDSIKGRRFHQQLQLFSWKAFRQVCAWWFFLPLHLLLAWSYCPGSWHRIGQLFFIAFFFFVLVFHSIRFSEPKHFFGRFLENGTHDKEGNHNHPNNYVFDQGLLSFFWTFFWTFFWWMYWRVSICIELGWIAFKWCCASVCTSILWHATHFHMFSSMICTSIGFVSEHSQSFPVLIFFFKATLRWLILILLSIIGTVIVKWEFLSRFNKQVAKYFVAG